MSKVNQSQICQQCEANARSNEAAGYARLAVECRAYCLRGHKERCGDYTPPQPAQQCILSQGHEGVHVVEDVPPDPIPESSSTPPHSEQSTVKELLALLKEADALLVEHHNSTMAQGWPEDATECPVCSNTGSPDIFSRISHKLHPPDLEAT